MKGRVKEKGAITAGFSLNTDIYETGGYSKMPSVVLIECDDETTSWQRAPSSVESQCNQGSANTYKITMSERFAVSKWPAGSAGWARNESSDSWVTFRMNDSLEMGNICACDTTSNSQCSVSKRTPEIHNYTYKCLSRRNTNTSPFILWVSFIFCLCIENFIFSTFYYYFKQDNNWLITKWQLKSRL